MIEWNFVHEQNKKYQLWPFSLLPPPRSFFARTLFSVSSYLSTSLARSLRFDHLWMYVRAYSIGLRNTFRLEWFYQEAIQQNNNINKNNNKRHLISRNQINWTNCLHGPEYERTYRSIFLYMFFLLWIEDYYYFNANEKCEVSDQTQIKFIPENIARKKNVHITYSHIVKIMSLFFSRM